jgi:RsbT co-antagonist protein rsbRD N-terminal domain
MSLPALAALIQAHNKDIVSKWIQTVRNDPRIHSDEDLSDEGLKNHVPFIIEEICQLLRLGETPEAANTREGRVHVYTRYHLGYRARDLVSEISLLRLILLDDLAEHLFTGRVKGDLKTYMGAARIINRYIDEELRYAISVYTEADKREQPMGAL